MLSQISFVIANDLMDLYLKGTQPFGHRIEACEKAFINEQNAISPQ
jgi:hypothetical protein